MGLFNPFHLLSKSFPPFHFLDQKLMQHCSAVTRLNFPASSTFGRAVGLLTDVWASFLKVSRFHSRQE